MSQSCAICGKSSMAGQHIRHRHSGQWKFRAPRTKRLFRPNLQQVRLPSNGEMKKAMVCTKCMKAGKVLTAA